MKRKRERRSVWEMYNSSRQKLDGLDTAQITILADGRAKMRYKQDLGGIVSSGSMVEELDANGNSYERIYRKNAILILVSDPISITPPAVVERNLGNYPKGVLKRSWNFS